MRENQESGRPSIPLVNYNILIDEILVGSFCSFVLLP